MKQPLVSVIVCTYDRPHYLKKLFKKLKEQSYKSFEVIVVYSQKDIKTHNICTQYKNIKSVVVPTNHMMLQRNAGISNSAGKYIGFIDDDAIPENTDWIKNYVKKFESDPKIAALGSNVYNYHAKGYEFSIGMCNDYGFQVFNCTKEEMEELKNKGFYPRAQGCNSFFKKDAIIEIGGFDMTYKYYADETDICVKLIKAGYKVDYAEDATVIHFKDFGKSTSRSYIDWDIITKSDTYFALRHAKDFLPIRIIKTIYYAPKKHFVKEHRDAYREKRISRSEYNQFLKKWIKGIFQGIYTYFKLINQKPQISMKKDVEFIPYIK